MTDIGAAEPERSDVLTSREGGASQGHGSARWVTLTGAAKLNVGQEPRANPPRSTGSTECTERQRAGHLAAPRVLSAAVR